MPFYFLEGLYHNLKRSHFLHAYVFLAYGASLSVLYMGWHLIDARHEVIN